MLPNRNRQEIEDRLIRISKILNDTYKNKSSEEYKMSGDITKSSYYSNIEKCIADLSTLRGFSKSDASDLNQMFNTLHRPFFKNMVKEYMSEPNEKNTVFCALFTLGFRLLIGELSRIYTSVEATSRGLEYKPDKVSRRNDVSKIISIYKGDLESKINAEIRATSKASTKIEESYLEDVIAQMYIEEFLDEKFGETIYDEAAKVEKEDMRDLLDSLIKPIQEAHFGRFREIRGDSPDMELPSLRNKRPPADDTDVVMSKLPQIKGQRQLFDDSERPREVGGLEEPRLKRFDEEGEISTAVDPSYGTTTDTDVSDTDSNGDSAVSSVEEGQSCTCKPVQEAKVKKVEFGADTNNALVRLVDASKTTMSLDDIDSKWDTSAAEEYEQRLKNMSKEERAKHDAENAARHAERIQRLKEQLAQRRREVNATSECGDCNTQPVQEGVVDNMEKMSGRISDIADTIGPKISNIAAWAAPIAAGLSIFAGLFKRVTGFLSGKNPIAELNFYFTNKYEKIISKFNAVSANYFATKEAYDEYMKIPESQRKKKVESKYLQNLEKYNIRMKNLNAQIEHFNSRASADATTPVPKPTSKPAPKQPDTSNDNGDNKPKDDDDFDF